MSCISRVTAIDARCYFADQKHKFFLEMRCGRSCSPDQRVCVSCSIKTASTIQWCRKIDHGTIYDPIPDRSHLFGGNWYEEGVQKWGAPSVENIQLAMEYQQEARMGTVELSKVTPPSPDMEKPKRGRKPKVVANAVEPVVVETRVTEVRVTEVPVTEVPVTEPAVEHPIETAAVTAPASVASSEPPKPKRTRKPKPKVLTPIKMADPSMIQKEVVLPTHMEQTRDEVDTDGFEIEYVKLSVFAVGDISYFRDAKKNKLYKKIKEKTIGDYVGRYDPASETIYTDVPDSDEEQHALLREFASDE